MNMFVSTAAAVASVPAPALAGNQSDKLTRLSAMLARAEEIV
ncbi:hypothetical protein QA635_03880 [Bradyrhizobium brasilense]|nr:MULTISPECIES: hypothetical protein [Bradyrhizobium]WFU33600.1 hypothetical protein QA635_03880 [Bradyrhizobium australafricanum]